MLYKIFFQKKNFVRLVFWFKAYPHLDVDRTFIVYRDNAQDFNFLHVLIKYVKISTVQFLQVTSSASLGKCQRGGVTYLCVTLITNVCTSRRSREPDTFIMKEGRENR